MNQTHLTRFNAALEEGHLSEDGWLSLTTHPTESQQRNYRFGPFSAEQTASVREFAFALYNFANNYEDVEEKDRVETCQSSSRRRLDPALEYDAVVGALWNAADVALSVATDLDIEAVQKKVSADKLSLLKELVTDQRRFRFAETVVGERLGHLFGVTFQNRLKTHDKQVYAVLADSSVTHYAWVGTSINVLVSNLPELLKSSEEAAPHEVVLGFLADEGEEDLDAQMAILQEVFDVFEFSEKELRASAIGGCRS